jgi:hypothetical protein
MNDLIKLLRGRRIDGRSADEIMRLAADEIESLQSQLSYRRNLTAALRREVASKDRLAEADALLREARDPVEHTAKGALNLLHTEVAQDLFSLLNRIDAHLAREEKP